jgi:hypothetical protein
MTRVGGLLDRMMLPACVGWLGEPFGFTMICVGVRSEKLAMFIITPFISLVGVALCR